MAHHTGFTSQSLRRICAAAGFRAAACGRGRLRELWGIAMKAPKTTEEMHELAKFYITPL
jgi:hypothetical protein